jgi:predicted AlkP superfamily phosphohydrolase/phosphomutase
MGYKIDADAAIAYRSKDEFLQELYYVLEHRAKVMFHLMDTQPWDFFMSHIMETDRLHHFYWEYMENYDPKWTPAFHRFYSCVDQIIGQVWERVDKDTTLLMLSDHGFCTVRKEVYLNHYLREKGWMHFAIEHPKTLAEMTDQSRAYSLDPGRVFINLRGREPRGRVEPGAEYERVRQQLIEELLELRDPENGAKMVVSVFRREEIYHGDAYENAPDLVINPSRGYAFKGALDKGMLTWKGDVLIGEHTYDDALLYISGHEIAKQQLSMVDVLPAILYLLGVPIPNQIDGVMAITA